MALLSEAQWRLTYTRHFVEAIGFTLGLDGELLIERVPESVSVEKIVELLNQVPESLAFAIKSDAERARRQFVGGPLNGKRHERYPLGYGEAIVRRLGVSRELIRNRLDRLGWTVERALGQPAYPLHGHWKAKRERRERERIDRQNRTRARLGRR